MPRLKQPITGTFVQYVRSMNLGDRLPSYSYRLEAFPFEPDVPARAHNSSEIWPSMRSCLMCPRSFGAMISGA